MTERAEPRNPKQQKPAPKPGVEMAERELDKVSGGVTARPPKTANPPSEPIPVPNPPSVPIPVPYPNET
jgi:hypothetical protein